MLNTAPVALHVMARGKASAPSVSCSPAPVNADAGEDHRGGSIWHSGGAQPPLKVDDFSCVEVEVALHYLGKSTFDDLSQL